MILCTNLESDVIDVEGDNGFPDNAPTQHSNATQRNKRHETTSQKGQAGQRQEGRTAQRR